AQFEGEENVVTHKDGTSDVSEETKTCPNCGKSIPANSARCPNCGKKFE
ncbi:MAG: zinc-ribbon domain-containing protein, partial [Candidatus Methanomethylophilus sp.]|nr:zinc-ribbon domain-containing protein [Methanomethylophilus sp.]